MMTAKTPPRDPEIDRLLDRIGRDGVPLPPQAILAAVAEPCWGATRAIHDWRTYVPPSVRETWDSLPLYARLCIYETAELMALDEDVGASMVTGPADGP